MTDLKFTVSYRKTVSDGNYGGEQFGHTHEFDVGSCTVQRAFSIVKREVEDMILEASK